MISMNKKYRTRDGREVRIYAVDGDGNYPVHGAFLDKDGWVSVAWKTNGSWCEGLEDGLDLVEVKPRIQRKVWVNVYPHNASYFRNREAADANALDNRIACVEIDIDVEEGHGL